MRVSAAGAIAGLMAVLLAAGCASTPAGQATTAPVDTAGGAPAAEQPAAQPPRTAAVRLAIAPADKATEISPTEQVKVTAGGGKLTTVVVTNPDGKQVKGKLAADGQTWSSAEPLGYSRTYTVTATGTSTDGQANSVTSTFTTIKPRTLTYASMNPLDGQVVGVGQPIAVYFDEPIKDKQTAQKAITIKTTPAVNGAFYWYSDKEVHWRPERYWAPGTKVVADIDIYGKNLGGGIYGEKDRRVTFRIGDAVVAEADGASHQMVVAVNGSVVKTMPISMGKPKFETSTGVHVVTEKNESRIMDSSTYGLPVDAPEGYRTKVDWATRISNSGIFVHSAPWSVRDQGRRNVSHGCLNVSPENAKWVFDTFKKGDIVIVRNSGGSALRAHDGFGDWNVPWGQWVSGGRK